MVSQQSNQKKLFLEDLYLKKTLLIENAAVDKQLSSLECRLLTILLTRVNHITGLCNPSEKTLAKALCGVCEMTVKRAIKNLKNTEYIFIKHRYRNSNYYSFNWSKAIPLDLRKEHLEVTPVFLLKDAEKEQICPSEVTNLSVRSNKSVGLEVTPVFYKPTEGNLLNQPIEFNLGDEEKNEAEEKKCFSHKESPPPTFISHNNSAKQADAGEPVKTFISHNEKAAAAGNGAGEPDRADAADKFQDFWNAYKPDGSQDKYLPGIRAAFIQKVTDGIAADEIIDGAKRAAETGVNRTTLPLQWLRNEMWNIKKPSLLEELEIANSRNARREQLDNERKEIIQKFDDDNCEEDRRRIEQCWGVVNNLLSENTPLRGFSAQWVIDHQQHIDELCATYPDKLLTTLGTRFAQLKTLGGVVSI